MLLFSQFWLNFRHNIWKYSNWIQKASTSHQTHAFIIHFLHYDRDKFQKLKQSYRVTLYEIFYRHKQLHYNHFQFVYIQPSLWNFFIGLFHLFRDKAVIRKRLISNAQPTFFIFFFISISTCTLKDLIDILCPNMLHIFSIKKFLSVT